jgi:hypothetical protein
MTKKSLMIGLSVLLLTFVGGIVYAQSVTPGFFLPTDDSVDYTVYIGDFDDDGWCVVTLSKRVGDRVTASGYGKIRNGFIEVYDRKSGSSNLGRGAWNIRIVNNRQLVYSGRTFNHQNGT